MRTIFSKILLAQVVAVALALIVVTVITRASLNQGFKDFLERQESTVLQTLAPVLTDFYETKGGWDSLRNNPEAWQHIWRVSRAPHGRQPQSRLGQGRPPTPDPGSRRGKLKEEGSAPPEPSLEAQLMRWTRSSDGGRLRERLFLLDENLTPIAGDLTTMPEHGSLETIEFEGQIVGWIGFTPMGKALPPDAERFLNGQIRITAFSLAIALVVAAALAYLLARNVSRPVRRLGETVRDLSRGDFLSRAGVETRDEIGSLAQHVNQLAATLEQNRTARHRWIADIAHELRTPVAILKGEIEALADGVRPADVRMSNSLREEVDQLSALINDLQTLALSDTGALNVKKEPVNFSGLVTQCLESFGDRLAARDISTEVVMEQEVLVSADPQRLRQLVHNLLENSSRYVTQGGRIRVSLARTEGAAEWVLEDSGPGLERAQLERLFERFYRVESSRARSSGGTGLGLSICKNIVEAHGGSIVAEPSAMGGLKMRIVLPD